MGASWPYTHDAGPNYKQKKISGSFGVIAMCGDGCEHVMAGINRKVRAHAHTHTATYTHTHVRAHAHTHTHIHHTRTHTSTHSLTHHTALAVPLCIDL